MYPWKRVAFVMLVGLSQMAAAAPLTDTVLGRFVGSWKISGTTLGEKKVSGAEVQPQIGGAFVELHIKDPAGASPYEARLFLGEAADGTVIAHWFDVAGAGSAATLGRGRFDGDRLVLTFPYPEGEMRSRFDYDRAQDRWHLVVEMGASDTPKIFSDWYFDRTKRR